MSRSVHRWQPGSLFLGTNSSGVDCGISTERHALTIGGAGSGKGIALLIQNARRWTQNLLVIDPKGENVELSYEAREAMASPVYAIDPFRIANIPEHHRASFNPLQNIDPDHLTAREEIEAISDGLVRRSDPKHAEWDDGARDILAGVMAYVVGTAPLDHRNLTALRNVLLQPSAALYEDAQRMLDCTACGGLAKAAGITIMTAIESQKGMEKDFLNGARRHSKWLDSPAMKSATEKSSFDLADIKNGRASVYLVLPPQYMDTHAAFLRLFVRCGLNAMAKGGSGKGNRCLFLMDEFHTLGRIDEIAKAAGLMRSYGVHLWPFLQNLGQLQDLYGPNGSQTFFANADAHIFLGVHDQQTLQYISSRIGAYDLNDATNFVRANRIEPPKRSDYFSDDRYILEIGEYTRKKDELTKLSQVGMGSPRMPPNTVAEMIGKTAGSITANQMIVFTPGGNCQFLTPKPYWVTASTPAPVEYTAPSTIVYEVVADITKTRNKNLIVFVVAMIAAPALMGINAVILSVIASALAVWTGITCVRLEKQKRALES
jgi:type IV secretory pathway TraG/TraD family ATPase VirD4